MARTGRGQFGGDHFRAVLIGLGTVDGRAVLLLPQENPPGKDHPFTVLYAGRLAEEKKIDIVIRAAAQARTMIPNIRVIIVGRGAYEAQLRSLVQELGMEHAVTFAGFVPSEHLASYYAKSDVFAIMSTAETQSIVAMQALACAIPVIAADAWGF